MTDQIALGMIVKGTGDEPLKLRNVLGSIHNHLDKIFVTITGPKDEIKDAEQVCREFGVEISYHRPYWTATTEAVSFLKQFFGYDPVLKVGDQVFLYDEARNFNMSQISQEKYPWILWLDCDDVFLKGENLREVAKMAQQNGVEAVYFNYIYQAELDENRRVKHILIEHLRERLVRNTGVYKWISPIHETLIEQRPTRKTDNYDCAVLHLSEEKDRLASLQRNLRSLEYAIYTSEGKDPRHVYYLAKAFYDLNTPEFNEKAMKLIDIYLNGENPSGWTEERAQAYEYLAEIYRRKGEHNNSIKACMNALIETPENPTIFINLALSYMCKQDWDRSLFWVKQASSVPQKKTTLVVNPKDIQARTLEVIYNASLNLSRVDEAWAAMVKLVELFPNDPNVNQSLQYMQMIRDQRDATKYVTYLADYLKKTGETAKVKALVAAIPQTIANNSLMVSLYQKNNPPTPWGEKDIAIYCGPGFTPWSPKKLKEPGLCFVGGSEEAVIYASEELVKQGWNVTVYGDPATDEGVINGVKWLPYYKFNHLDFFNIVIAWRDIRFFDSNLNIKKAYLWCHDIQNPLEFTKERVEKIHKVFFLSKWHRDNVPELSEDKVLLTSNGI